jgi:type IX secretion system PorP/SprF family membrane protein
MKQTLLCAIFFLTILNADAQQLPVSSFYEMYAVLHNPATAGAQHSPSIGASFRTQWSGMPGAPRTGLIFGSTWLQKANLGIGGYLYNDVTGPTTRNGLQMAYAYQIPLKNKTLLSLGLEARVLQFSYDRLKLQGSLGTNDPVTAGNERRIKGDAGFGMAITSEKFQAGVSVSQLIQSRLNLYTGTGSPDEEAQLYRHYYLHGYYKLDLDGQTKIIPNILLVYLPNAPVEVQGGARIEHNDLFWYGLTWRANQAWMLSAGVKIKQRFTIGYSFDIYMTPLSMYDKGSNGHELMLRYDFLD